MPIDAQALVAKIQALPAERIAEVEDFVEFIHLRERERSFVRDAAASSAPAFAAIWDNSEDGVYDAL
jgi:hypothetical protein